MKVFTSLSLALNVNHLLFLFSRDADNDEKNPLVFFKKILYILYHILRERDAECEKNDVIRFDADLHTLICIV